MGDVAYIEIDSDVTKLWHMPLGRLSERWMMEIRKRNFSKGIFSCTIGLCAYCVLGKQCRVRFKTRQRKTKEILDYVHSYVQGPTKDPSVGGSK